MLSGWGSGTGGAGVAGALLYSAFTQAGLSPRNTLLIMLVVPAIMMFRSGLVCQRPEGYIQIGTPLHLLIMALFLTCIFFFQLLSPVSLPSVIPAVEAQV